jgi:hypothetical protein
VSATDYDKIDRFLVFAEQLDVACDLLEDGAISKARAALVGIDNLASLLLRAHAEAVFRSGEGPRWDRAKRYTNKERRTILGNFGRMATLATEDADGPALWKVGAILSEADAAVMRVAHTYRNGVYHEDRHNRALLTPLAALYAQALGRAFCAYHRRGWSYGIDAARAERVRALGFQPEPDRLTPSAMMLNFGAAATTVVENLTGRFEVDQHALGEWLAADIVQRTAWSAGVLTELLDDGMTTERLEWIFRWSQFWAAHGADQTWLALEDERDELGEALRASGRSSLDEEDFQAAAYRAADAAYIAHGHELQRNYKPAVHWGDAPSLGQRGKRLKQAKDVASLLSRYSQIDSEVERLEAATMEAASAWDEMVEHAIDHAREA